MRESHEPEAALAQFEVLDHVGITAFNVLLFDPTGWQYPGAWSPENLTAWLAARSRYPGRLSVFGSVDFRRLAKTPTFFDDIVLELEHLARMGMQGVKISKNLGMYHRDADGKLLRIDDRRLDPFWEKCADLHLPVLIHSADPREYW